MKGDFKTKYNGFFIGQDKINLVKTEEEEFNLKKKGGGVKTPKYLKDPEMNRFGNF
jgi:hypothetical protein